MEYLCYDLKMNALAMLLKWNQEVSICHSLAKRSCTYTL